MGRRGTILVRIGDDGPGYPPHLMGRLGEPYLRRPARRRGADRQRPGYEGMGLGLFIAKTLLERSGASLRFRNDKADEDTAGGFGGAIAEVVWPRPRIEAPPRPRLGENRPRDPATGAVSPS
jgi:two-component system, sensor histidine kinase RegB